MNAHDCSTPTPGCYRCELNEDELDGYGYCNSCGEEMWEGDDCCDDGEWTAASLSDGGTPQVPEQEHTP
jgi:hypothetical protein